ncbi:hypothetical protein [Arcticibacter sp. MXS-1]|uniref:hypothetical protein n=1 Tax=Arcticibacter sp. MXS-1 TaxID=3341726 RepID=UPI0035A81890
MRKLFTFLSLIFALVVFSKNTANAQYKNALGVRVGDYTGISFKTFLQQDRALDLILGFKDKSSYSAIRFTGLYEVHKPIPFEDGTLQWYYGGGASIGGIDYKNIDKNDFLLSADGVLGLDYRFAEAPINVSFDWKPALQFTPDADFKAGQFGFSVRVTF